MSTQPQEVLNFQSAHRVDVCLETHQSLPRQVLTPPPVSPFGVAYR